MSITGDYSSMAEAVGEAPPRTGLTGDEIAEIYHDCGDPDEAYDMVLAVDAAQMRDHRAWHEANGGGYYERRSAALEALARRLGASDDDIELMEEGL